MLSFRALTAIQEASNALQICPVVRRHVRSTGIRGAGPARAGTGQLSARHERLRLHEPRRERVRFGARAAARLQPARRHLGQVFAAAQRLQRAAARRAAVREVHERRLLVDDGVPREPAEGQQAARSADDERAVLALRQDVGRLGQLQQQRPGELPPSQSRPRPRRRREHAGARVEVRGQHPRPRRLGPDDARRRFTRASCRIRSSARRRSSARGSARRTR